MRLLSTGICCCVAWQIATNILKECAISDVILLSCSENGSSTLLQNVGTSHQTTLHHIPRDGNHRSPLRENLRAHVHFCFWFGVAGTIAPAREIPEQGANSPIRIFLSNLNLVVPVAAAVLVIIIAVVVICVLRGKNLHQKGKRHCVL